MTTSRFIRVLFTCCSTVALTACAYGGSLPESVAVAKNSPTAQTPGGLLTIANDMARKGDHEAAIPLYRHIASTTRTPEAITGLANSLLALGNLNAAQKLLADFIAHQGIENTSGEMLYSYGKASLASGNFDAALEGFNAAESTMSNDPRPTSGRAVALAATGNSTGALQLLNNATDLTSLSNKALILAANNMPDAAINILEPIIATGNSSARDRQNLSLAYLLAGKEEQAYTMARLDLDPASINETFTFYRTLTSLEEKQRMQALVTGTVNPEWTTEEAANMQFDNTIQHEAAAVRLTTISPPQESVSNESADDAQQEEETHASTANATPEKYGLSEVPPLVERQGWALQIGAYRTINRLMQGWSLLLERNTDILSNIPPRRSEVDFGTQTDGPSGFYFRLNAGPLASFAEAKQICDELLDRGTSCWIRPPEKQEGDLPGS
ncbi:tetratricopeptide repeat protein [Kordiimonas aquimaris]|uniref:tetratricopeptide repeat protein n=1 Tax=Kordiimonas aquimaris TaxID=707591 RepID=UPI0021D28F86|nr:SPOR domain-containing protein [Kordiimonas aquimaris]